MQHIELLHTIGDLLQWTLDTQALYKLCWTQLMMLMQHTDLLLDQGPGLASTVLAQNSIAIPQQRILSPSSFAPPCLARSHSRAQFARIALPRANRAQPQRAHLAQPQRPAHRRSPSPSLVQVQIHLRMLVRKNILQIQQYSLSAFV
ncbi:hypothetical protein ACOSP7_021319 [Xanthoceras sorbifolium]